MIGLIFLMLSRRQPYIDQGTDFAAMRAKKNAPRWIKQLKASGRWPTPKPAATGTLFTAEFEGSGPAVVYIRQCRGRHSHAWVVRGFHGNVNVLRQGPCLGR